MTRRHILGFTLVELLVVIAVIGILASVAIVSYADWRQTTSSSAVRSDMQQAIAGLESYRNFKSTYPPNMAGTGFAASKGVALTLATNAPTIGTYSNLTPDQNAQLFINACNANITDTPNNTSCKAEGSGGGAKIHAKGTSASNTIWPSPVGEGDLQLNCGAVCDQVVQTMIQQFKAQGGTFPIVVNKQSTSLPEPDLTPNGDANRFCLEGRSVDFPSIVYHTTNGSSAGVVAGHCASDPDLHYFP